MSEFDFGDASKNAVGVYRFMTSTTGNSKYTFGKTTDHARRDVNPSQSRDARIFFRKDLIMQSWKKLVIALLRAALRAGSDKSCGDAIRVKQCAGRPTSTRIEQS